MSNEKMLQEGQGLSLLPYFDQIIEDCEDHQQILMWKTILHRLTEMLGEELIIPKDYMLSDLPHRFQRYLIKSNAAMNTIKSYSLHLNRALREMARRFENINHASILPDPLPFPPSEPEPISERLQKEFARFESWRGTERIPLDQIGKGAFRRYQKYLLQTYKYGVARRYYGDLITFWNEHAARWELPFQVIPDIPAKGKPRFGLDKERWPPQLGEDLDHLVRFLRGIDHATRLPVVRIPARKPPGDGWLHRLYVGLRLFLGYCANVKEMEIQGWDLLTAVTSKETLLKFQEWHSLERNQGKPMVTHKYLFEDFAILLEYFQQPYLAEVYRSLARQMKPERKRIRFRDTVPSYSTLLVAAQSALQEATLETERILKSDNQPSEHKLSEVASLYQDSLIFSLLIFRPLREANVIEMELGRNLVKGPDNRWKLYYEPIQFKSKVKYQIDFPQALVPFLEQFLAVWRPRLNLKDSSVMFLTRKGGPLRPKAINDRMVELGAKHLDPGIRTNPHHFRMLVATSYLAENPGEFEQIRQLLGHKFIKTTLKHYLFVFCLNASRIVAQFAREEFDNFRGLAQAIDLPDDLKVKTERMMGKAAA